VPANFGFATRLTLSLGNILWLNFSLRLGATWAVTPVVGLNVTEVVNLFGRAFIFGPSG
jgi:hypothetical protein